MELFFPPCMHVRVTSGTVCKHLSSHHDGDICSVSHGKATFDEPPGASIFSQGRRTRGKTYLTAVRAAQAGVIPRRGIRSPCSVRCRANIRERVSVQRNFKDKRIVAAVPLTHGSVHGAEILSLKSWSEIAKLEFLVWQRQPMQRVRIYISTSSRLASFSRARVVESSRKEARFEA